MTKVSSTFSPNVAIFALEIVKSSSINIWLIIASRPGRSAAMIRKEMSGDNLVIETLTFVLVSNSFNCLAILLLASWPCISCSS